MEIFNIEKHWDKFIEGHICINCKTEELANEFLLHCHNEKMTWHDGNSLVSQNEWYNYKSKTCYWGECGMSYSEIYDYNVENNRVVEFAGLTQPETKEKVMNPIEFFESIVSSQLSSQINQETIKNAVFTLNNYPPTTTTKENIEVIYHRKETIVLIKTNGKYFKGVSRCHNEDTYDKEVGFMVAYQRARENQNRGNINEN